MPNFEFLEKSIVLMRTDKLQCSWTMSNVYPGLLAQETLLKSRITQSSYNQHRLTLHIRGLSPISKFRRSVVGNMLRSNVVSWFPLRDRMPRLWRLAKALEYSVVMLLSSSQRALGDLRPPHIAGWISVSAFPLSCNKWRFGRFPSLSLEVCAYAVVLEE